MEEMYAFFGRIEKNMIIESWKKLRKQTRIEKEVIKS